MQNGETEIIDKLLRRAQTNKMADKKTKDWNEDWNSLSNLPHNKAKSKAYNNNLTSES